MFLKWINSKTISSRLIIWTTVTLTFSLFAVSSTVYYLLSNSLRKTDQRFVYNMAKGYQEIINRRGLKDARINVSPELLVVVLDNEGNQKLLNLPEYLDGDFEDEDELDQIRTESSRPPFKEGWDNILLLSGEEDNDPYHRLEYKIRKYVSQVQWTSLLPLIDNDMLEVYTLPLENGYWLKVGKSSEEREEHLTAIRNISLAVLVPFILFGFILSIVLSRKILAPVKDLVRTIQKILNGDTKLKAHTRGTGDEIDILAEDFNSLLTHNEKLMSNLSSTIDNVAHDLRTPLTRFRASVEYALTQKNDGQALKEALHDGLESSEKILNLLNAIMDVSEAETQTMKINKTKIQLKSFITGLIDLFYFMAEEKSIRFESDIPDEISVLGDEVRLSQAFSNLLDNALKYSPNNTIVSISAFQQGDKAIISVQDQGMGIAVEFQERIWERLFRGDKSRSTQGLGIGLSVVRAIIMAHQGQVSVQSSLGTGSTFTIALPTCNAAVSSP